MYGSWLGFTMIGVFVLLALIGLFVLASPVFAVLILLLAVAALAAAVVVLRGRRTQQAGDSGAGEQARPTASDPYGGGPAPKPRSGGAPASGEGHAQGGETAGPASARG